MEAEASIKYWGEGMALQDSASALAVWLLFCHAAWYLLASSQMEKLPGAGKFLIGYQYFPHRERFV